MNHTNMENRHIPESELILNSDGSVYHLHLKPEHLASFVFAVGDPDRVPLVSKYFDQIDYKINKREFVTHTGWKKGKRLTVISTGMGTDNVEIFLTELDALVNIDLENRVLKSEKTRLQIVRLGTSGSLQPDIPTGSLLASEIGIGLDTLMMFYPHLSGNHDLANAIQGELDLGFLPYQAYADPELLSKVENQFIKGTTLTCPGFYAPQGRQVVLKPRIPFMLERLSELNISGKRLTNFEMETAGYYALGELLGHQMLSLNAIVANRPMRKFDPDTTLTVDRLIRTALESFGF